MLLVLHSTCILFIYYSTQHAHKNNIFEHPVCNIALSSRQYRPTVNDSRPWAAGKRVHNVNLQRGVLPSTTNRWRSCIRGLDSNDIHLFKCGHCLNVLLYDCEKTLLQKPDNIGRFPLYLRNL